jgi:hypothetical protein
MKGIISKIFFYSCRVEFRVISNLFSILGVSNKERQLIDERESMMVILLFILELMSDHG